MESVTEHAPVTPQRGPAIYARPFTPAMAAAAGVTRNTLERDLRAGRVVRLLRGVYVGAGRRLEREERATALGLVVGRRQAVVGRTAAWLHGCAVDALLLGLDPARGIPVELRSVADLRDRSVRVGAVRAEPVLDAALGLVRSLPVSTGLAVLDSLLHHRALRPADLHRTEIPDRRARETVARGDGRARSAAESVLRHHWLGARLPSPVPGVRLGTAGRVALALPWQRFAVTLEAPPEPVPFGWTVLRLPAGRVLEASGELVRMHLEREYHQHLLGRLE